MFCGCSLARTITAEDHMFIGSEIAVELKSDIPSVVKEFSYAKNCHYLRLTDDEGRSLTLVENALVQYYCGTCDFKFYAESRIANCCPVCRGAVTAKWMKPQIALVPEKESDFVMPRKKAK